MPTFDPDQLTARRTYELLTSLVVPRPIAWVGTRGADGVDNLAPHSYFNVLSSDPPVVHFTSVGAKDSLTNIRASGAFTITVATRGQLEAVNATAAGFPAEVDEFERAGVEAADATTVDAPYVLGSPAHLECQLHGVLSIGDGNMVLGDVRLLRVDDDVWVDEAVDMQRLDPVGRLSASQYMLLDELTVLERPTAEY